MNFIGLTLKNGNAIYFSAVSIDAIEPLDEGCLVTTSADGFMVLETVDEIKMQLESVSAGKVKFTKPFPRPQKEVVEEVAEEEKACQT